MRVTVAGLFSLFFVELNTIANCRTPLCGDGVFGAGGVGRLVSAINYSRTSEKKGDPLLSSFSKMFETKRKRRALSLENEERGRASWIKKD